MQIPELFVETLSSCIFSFSSSIFLAKIFLDTFKESDWNLPSSRLNSNNTVSYDIQQISSQFQTHNILNLNRKRKTKLHQEKTKYSKNNQVINNKTRFNSQFTFGIVNFLKQPNVFFLPRISFYIAIKRNFPSIFYFINK